MTTDMSNLTPLSHNLSIEACPIGQLQPYDRNARTHSKKQLEQIAGSIRMFGFNNPILIDANNRIIAGHGRVDAARLLGMETVPIIRLDHLSENEIRAYIIADNRLAELAGWDNEILAIEFQHLAGMDLDFDITITGFETPDIDVMIQGLAAVPDEDDLLPESDENEPAVSSPGDIWLLGDHRLVCGDALDPGCYEHLMPGETARLVFTDPPYNVPINGHVGGLGAIQHREFAMASGEMTREEFTTFLEKAIRHLVSNSMPGSLHYICMDWRHMSELLVAGSAVYSDLINLCVWNKSNGGMGSLYRSKHELVFVYKHGQESHINNVQLGRHGRYRTNVWDYPGVNSFKSGRMEELQLHPTVKPVAMVSDAILDASHRGEIVLDAFGGSGTTLIAAERTGRRARLLEIDPLYVDTTIRRWENLTGSQANHALSGKTFAAIAELRLSRSYEVSAVASTEVTSHG